MKTKQEIIDEVANFYNSKNRAVVKWSCCYETSDGRTCAVGRFMDPKKVNRLNIHGSALCITQIDGGHHVKLNKVLLDKYKGHEIEFWGDLQTFHDKSDFWAENGLSDAGRDFKKMLEEKYK